MERCIINPFFLLALIASLGFTLAGRVTAQTFTALHSFPAASAPLYNNTDGANPFASLILSGNTLYGTADTGGSSGWGTVFKVNTDGTGFTTLYSFTGGSDGADPYGGLILSSNTLYGTAYDGGSSGYGTLFKVNTDGTGFTMLYNFTGGSDGAYPGNGLILSGNTLYGTANEGGTAGNGTVFKVNTDSTGFATLHSFTAPYISSVGQTNSDGAHPYAGLILSGNTLYGTAVNGGSSGGGTVFAVNADGTGFTTLHGFMARDYSLGYGTNTDGSEPYAGLISSGNTLYGTAGDGGSSVNSNGGSSGGGTVFAVNTDGTDFRTLHSFTESSLFFPSTNVDGAHPYAGLILSGNTLYGTAANGGSSGGGTVFAINTDGTGFTTMHSFTAVSGPFPGTNSDGWHPEAGLILSGNTLFGAAVFGGSSGWGTVFSVLLETNPPSITTQPDDRTILCGSTVTFTVAVEGAMPLDYQWQFNGTNLSDDGRITGSETDTLTVTNVSTDDAGVYQVMVTNVHGSDLSVPATLRVVGMQEIIPDTEYFALVDFYSSTHGSVWLNSTNWLIPHAYPWYGVTVDDIGFDGDGNFISPGHVTGVELGTNNLNGLIPGGFFFLANLETLDLSGNQLSGSIPAGFSSLALTLNSFDLSHNSLTGSVPFDLFNLPFVRNFFLNNNKLDGPIPTGIGGLSQVQDLNLSGNSLTGAIPGALVFCTALTNLDLSDNLLSGGIPDQLTGLLDLESLDLSGNSLSGSIPLGFVIAVPLQHLDLSNNELNGSIPPSLGFLIHLQYLNLSRNKLVGSITPDFVSLQELTNLDLSVNHLSGSVPDFSGIASLESFEIQSNNLAVDRGSLSGTANLLAISNMVTHGEQVIFLPQNSPYINTQPHVELVSSGATAILTVIADGGPPLSYQWQVWGMNLTDDGRVTGSQTAALSIACASTNDEGYYQVTITNLYGFTNSDSVSLAIRPARAPPSLDYPINDQEAVFGAPFTYTFPADTFSDPDPGQTLIFIASGLPPGISLDGTSRTFSGIPTSVGGYVATVTATDNGPPPLQTNGTFNLVVAKANTALTVESSLNPALPGSSVRFTATASALPPSTAVPAGSVQFTLDGSVFGDAGPLLFGQASLDSSSLVHGSHSVTAEYQGTSNFNGSTNTLASPQIVNRPPTAGLATYTHSAGFSLKIPISQLLTNSTSDPDGDLRTLVSIGAGTNGATILMTGDWILYLPSESDPNRDATDHFDYTVSDNFPGGTVTAQVQVTITPPGGPSSNMLGLTRIGDSVRLSFAGIPNFTYRVQRTTLLEGNNAAWEDLGTATVSSTGTAEFTDANPLQGSAYYRTVWP